jgi:ADP-heptose:LPS heptosyltransferase
MINKTTLPEAFDIISKSRLHIDTDSGLAHAATAMSVPVVAIFGPSPKDFYGHAQNTNLFSTKTCSGGCFHLGERWQVGWMDKCPIGYQTPRCMDDVDPAMVLSAIEQRLNA